MGANEAMTDKARGWIGFGNLTLGVFALVALPAVYGLAEHLVRLSETAEAGQTAAVSVRLAGARLDVTLGVVVWFLGAVAGLVGSAIQQGIVFARRAGYGTLQNGYVWWYVLRPMWSALLGAIAVVACNAGLISIGDQTTSDAGITMLTVAGAIAGLYTDQVLQQLSQRLGATPPETVPA